MAAKTVEQQIADLIAKAAKSQKPTSDKPDTGKSKNIAKALVLFEKSKTLIDEAIAVLKGEDEGSKTEQIKHWPEYYATVEQYPNAPYGRKTNGIPKFAGGKAATTPAGQAFKKELTELLSKRGDTAKADDAPDAPQATSTTKGRGKK